MRINQRSNSQVGPEYDERSHLRSAPTQEADRRLQQPLLSAVIDQITVQFVQ